MCDTCRKIDPTYTNPLEDADETPTPSITVGTQVRLTGEVVDSEPDADGDYAVVVDGANLLYRKVYFKAADLRNLEVIRQPFKRGEVVKHKGDVSNEPLTVVDDERDGLVLVARQLAQTSTMEGPASFYERRP